MRRRGIKSLNMERRKFQRFHFSKNTFKMHFHCSLTDLLPCILVFRTVLHVFVDKWFQVNALPRQFYYSSIDKCKFFLMGHFIFCQGNVPIFGFQTFLPQKVHFSYLSKCPTLYWIAKCTYFHPIDKIFILELNVPGLWFFIFVTKNGLRAKQSADSHAYNRPIKNSKVCRNFTHAHSKYRLAPFS